MLARVNQLAYVANLFCVLVNICNTIYIAISKYIFTPKTWLMNTCLNLYYLTMYEFQNNPEVNRKMI